MNQLNQLTQESISLLKNNKFTEAGNLLDHIIKKYPKDDRAYINKTLLLINKSNYQKAYSFLGQIKKNFIKSSELFNASGIVNHKLNHFSEAEKDFKKAIVLDKKNFDAYINFCNLYIHNKNYKQALKLINQSLIINSNHVVFNEIKLFLLKKIGSACEIKIQEETLSRVVNLNQTFLKIQKSNINELLSLNQKLDKFKKDVDLYIQKASILFKLKKFEESLKVTEEALKINPKSFKTAEFRMKVLTSIGSFNEALKFCDSKINLNNSNILFYKAQILRAQKKINSYFDLMNNISPDNLNHENQYEYSKFLLSQNKFKEGWKFFYSRHETDAYKKYINQPFKTNKSKKIALLPELGLGDQILFITTLADYIKRDIQYDVYLDERLVYIFNKYSIFKNLSNVKFLSECNYSANKYDQALFLGDILSFTRSTKSLFMNQPDKLIEIGDSNRSSSKIKKIGVSWKSKNKKLNKDLSISNILRPLKNYDDVEIINLQYGDVSDLKEISSKLNMHVQINEEVDKFHDLEKLLMIIDSCDLVITSSNLTAHLSGILGKKTILLLPSKHDALWYWQLDENQSKWYSSIQIILLDNDLNYFNDVLRKYVE
jgi:tetratricopeptide (TPR) repeat protein